MPFGTSVEDSIDVAAVHRLTTLGAVVAHTAHGTSQEGLEAEWRIIILMVDGDLISRCEIFDEADLEAALARFEELQPRAPRLENAASQVTNLLAHSRPAIGTPWRSILADELLQRRSPSGCERRRPTRSGCKYRQTCEQSPRSDHERLVRRHRDPWRAPSPHSHPHLARRSGPETFAPRCSPSWRSTPTTGSRRPSFDSRRPRCCLRGARRPLLAGEAAAHAHTWRSSHAHTKHSTDANSLRRRWTG